jgi:DNA-binding MarR family transcriptional regulator
LTSQLVETDKRDRRSIIITATEKGTQIMHEGRGRREKQLLELLQPLRREEIDLLDRASKILAKGTESTAPLDTPV